LYLKDFAVIWYTSTLDDLCSSENLPREKFWASAFAVGSPEWFCKTTFISDKLLEKHLKPVDDDPDGTYIFNPSQSVLRRVWKKLSHSH